MRSFEIIVSLSLALGVSSLAAPVNPRSHGHLNTASPAEYNMPPVADCENEAGVTHLAPPVGTASQDISNPSGDNADTAIIPESASSTNFGGPVNQIPSSAVTTSGFSSAVNELPGTINPNFGASAQPNTLQSAAVDYISLPSSDLNSFGTGFNAMDPLSPIQVPSPPRPSINDIQNNINVVPGNVPLLANAMLTTVNPNTLQNAVSNIFLPSGLNPAGSIPIGINTNPLSSLTGPFQNPSPLQGGILSIDDTQNGIPLLGNALSNTDANTLQNTDVSLLSGLDRVGSIPNGINTNPLSSLTGPFQNPSLLQDGILSINDIQNGITVVPGNVPLLGNAVLNTGANTPQNVVLNDIPLLMDPVGSIPIGINTNPLSSLTGPFQNPSLLQDGILSIDDIQNSITVVPGNVPLLGNAVLNTGANTLQNVVLNDIPLLMDPVGSIPIGINTNPLSFLADPIQAIGLTSTVSSGVLSGNSPPLVSDLNRFGSIGTNSPTVNMPVISNIVSDLGRLSFTNNPDAAVNKNCICSL